MVPAAILRNCGTAVAICLLTVGVGAEHPIENLQLSCTGWRRAVEVLDPEVLAGWDERSDKRVGPLILPQVFAWRPILGVSGRQKRAGLAPGRQVQMTLYSLHPNRNNSSTTPLCSTKLQY